MQLNEEITTSYYKEFLSSYQLESIPTSLSNEDIIISENLLVHQLLNLQTSFFANRHHCWNLLQEIIQISMDDDHSLTIVCKEKVKDLINK